MHSEWGRIDRPTAERLNAARAAGGRLIAVGTTSLRLIESAADEGGTIQPFDGETAIFITPGYRFKAIDGLLTNFHLPRSTLFMLVSALDGSRSHEVGLCPCHRTRAIASSATAIRACCCLSRAVKIAAPDPSGGQPFFAADDRQAGVGRRGDRACRIAAKLWKISRSPTAPTNPESERGEMSFAALILTIEVEKRRGHAPSFLGRVHARRGAAGISGPVRSA